MLRIVAAFQSRFARVTGRAQRLQIGQIERQFGMRPHRPNVIDFESAD